MAAVHVVSFVQLTIEATVSHELEQLKSRLRHIRGKECRLQNSSSNMVRPSSECGLDLEIQINTFSTLKVKGDHRSKFSNLSNWKEEA